MRVNFRILTLLGCSVILLAAWTRIDAVQKLERMVDSTRMALLRIESEIRLRSALDGYQTSREGFVIHVDSNWFKGGPPRNQLLQDSNRPWIEVEKSGNRSMRHPRDASATSDGAEWWYTPANGVVRANVPAQGTNRDTNELYERVNR